MFSVNELPPRSGTGCRWCSSARPTSPALTSRHSPGPSAHANERVPTLAALPQALAGALEERGGPTVLELPLAVAPPWEF